MDVVLKDINLAGESIQALLWTGIMFLPNCVPLSNKRGAWFPPARRLLEKGGFHGDTYLT